MDALSLLRQAREAGLRVEPTGDKLMVRGPRQAEPMVKLLAEHKAAILAALAKPAHVLLPTDGKPSGHRLTAAQADETGHPSTQPVRRSGNVHLSSRTALWSTPQDLFDALDEEFGFTLDVCAIPANAKCKAFYTPAENGLLQPWSGVCWMNPPYGREIPLWLAKAREAVRDGATVVALVPARTDTRWWHDMLSLATEVRYQKGRLKFGGAEHCAPFPSAVVVMKPPVSEIDR